MRNRFMIYNIHAHFMMERKGIEISKKITQCELLLLNYNLFLCFDISIFKKMDFSYSTYFIPDKNEWVTTLIFLQWQKNY